jgi:hypothetical protein
MLRLATQVVQSSLERVSKLEMPRGVFRPSRAKLRFRKEEMGHGASDLARSLVRPYKEVGFLLINSLLLGSWRGFPG